MRFETIKASAYLVGWLQYAGLKIHQDGGDIVLVGLPSGETVSIHLIESPLPLYEIRSILEYNAARSYYTLFVLWCDLLLPPEGHLIETQDWEEALLLLYEDRIYAFEIFGSEVFIFAVHFDREGRYRHIRYGDTLRLDRLSVRIAETTLRAFTGAWRVAHVGEAAAGARPSASRQASALRVYYDVLDLAEDVGQEAVKLAYRRLARLYHPDVNPAPDATARMQAINEAYEKIMQQFEDER